MIRFGIIGTNWITEEFLKAAQAAEHFTLTAVYSRTEERAREFAAKWGAATVFTDIEAMAASDSIDAVYIASPNSFHAKQAIVLMDGGKHVLCEKPIASNAKELEAMIAAAQRSGIVLMEALKTTLLPNFSAIRTNVSRIGQVRRYFASYCQYSSRYDAYRNGTVLNAFNPTFSNGALMDLGIYCLYPLVALFGAPKSIQATGVMLDSGVDGAGSILLSYPDMDAVVMYSKITSSALPSEIHGEDGSLVIDKINQPEKVELRYRNGVIEDVTRPSAQHTMFYEIEEFIRLIRSGERESAINSHAVSLAAMRIMDEARAQIGLVYPADIE